MTLVLPLSTSFGSLAGLGVREDTCDWLQATPCATASMGTQTTPFTGVGAGDSQPSGYKVQERCRAEVEPPCRPPTPPPGPAAVHKRKLPLDELTESRPRRISPFLNTPKQKRDEKRRVLRLSIQKLRQIDDPEVFLRRSVLINNTMKRMQKELREEKYASSYRSSADPPPRKRACVPDPTPSPSPSYMHLFDDPPNHFVNEMRITDDMSETLVRTVMGLGDSPSTSNPASSPSGLLTPSSSPSSTGTDANSTPCATTDHSAPCQSTENSAPYKTDSASVGMDAHSAPCAKSKDCPMETDSELNNNSRLCPNHNTNSKLSCPISDCSMELTDLTNYFPDDKFVNVTERDRQILGEMDAVFNNLISVLTES